MTKFHALRDLLFRIRYGFRGVPLSLNGHVLRLDESLRHWNPDVEKEIQTVLCAHLKAGDVIVDVGANFGLHTLLAADCVGPSGHVFAIEPIPFNYRLLQKHLSLNAFEKRVTIIPEAAADAAGGVVELHGAGDEISFSASLRKTAGAGRSIKAPVTTLDECLKARSRPVNFIKIDVEGAEHLVLKGARRVLSEDRPLLLMEVHSFALPSFGSSAAAVQEEVRQLGYRETVIDVVDGAEGSYFHALYEPDRLPA